MSKDDRNEFKHPSYGMIAFNRVMYGSSCRLFGSPLDTHYSTVRISIGSGVRIHESHHDRYHGSLRGEYIEVEMSAAQFAEVLVSMNQGSGIPCTIRRLNGEPIPEPPPAETEATKIKQDFAKSVEGYRKVAKEYASEITKLCETLPAKKRERIRIALECMENQMGSNIPFVLKQFEEASTRVVTAAKHELNAFATLTLGESRPALPAFDDTKALPEPEEPKPTPITIKRGRLEQARARIAESENKTASFVAEQLAAAITGYLEEFETHAELLPSVPTLFHAHATTSRDSIIVTYVSYQGHHRLTIEEAERYLAWLDGGNIGRHFEALDDRLFLAGPPRVR